MSKKHEDAPPPAYGSDNAGGPAPFNAPQPAHFNPQQQPYPQQPYPQQPYQQPYPQQPYQQQPYPQQPYPQNGNGYHAPQPMGYQQQPYGYAQQPYGQPYGYQQQPRRDDSFMGACLAALACCCCLDACLLF